MKRVAIIGSGDLARLVVHNINTIGDQEVVGVYDDFVDIGTNESGLLIIGRLDKIQEDYQNNKFDFLFIAVGYSRMNYRAETFNRFKGVIPFTNIIHKSCIIDPSVKLGEGVFLFSGVLLDQNVVIRDNVLLNVGVTIAHDSQIGEHCFFGPRVNLAGFVKIEEMGYFGINSTVIDNINVCSNVKVGAGAVITKNIKEEGLYVGIPAKKIK